MSDLPRDQRDDFSSFADEDEPGFLIELRDFFADTKKWWLTPIVVVLLLMGMLLVFAGSAVAPLIYPLM